MAEFITKRICFLGKAKKFESPRRFRVREVAPLDEFDIELDVYDKMPVATAVVGSSGIRDVGSAKPSPVLPEGIGHD